jgi:hypothetical protein
MTGTVMTRNLDRLAGAALALVGLLSILVGLFLGLNGIRVTETFGMSGLRHVQDGMFLHRIDLKSWPEPPYQVIDDGRYGNQGTLTRLSMDGVEFTHGRASRTDLLAKDTAAYLHTGVGNLYISPGPQGTPDSEFTATFVVRLDPAIWACIAFLGGLLLVAGLALLFRIAALYDLALVILLIVLAAGSWLNFKGLEIERDLDVSEARELSPYGYVLRLPRIGPLIVPPTDRGLPDISGRLHEDGHPVGNSLALSPEIIKIGNGAHLMASGGAFYFSLPGNADPARTSSHYSVSAKYFLPNSILLLSAVSFALLICAGLSTDGSRMLAECRRPRYRLTAVAVPLVIATTVTSYLGWLYKVDALHMHSPPQERDWFTANEGWRMAGLVRTYPYEGIIVGTSVSQNFYMAEATDLLGLPMLNATMAGSTPREQAALIDLALRRDTTQLVVWEIHVTGFTQPVETTRPQYFPAHLFDTDLLNDLEYFFSLQAWLDARGTRYAHDGGRLQLLDPINKWGERMDFGPTVVAKTYCKRRNRRASPLRAEALAENIRSHVLPLVQAHPEKQFNLFIPAYPVLMHLPEGGRLTGLQGMARIMFEVLGEQPNVTVFDFQNIGPEIGDPELHRDDIHYHPTISSRILNHLSTGHGRVTRSDLPTHEARLADAFDVAGRQFRAVMDPICEAQKG